MTSSSKFVIGIAAAGMMAVGAAAVAASAGADCAGSQWSASAGSRFDPAARAEQRLARLKAALKITPEQEPLWQSFADTAKSEAGKGFQAMREQAKNESLTAPERMARMTDIMKQRLAALESVGGAFNRLYQGLTPEQRKVADEHAARMARMGFGHHHPGPMMKPGGQPPADAPKG